MNKHTRFPPSQQKRKVFLQPLWEFTVSFLFLISLPVVSPCFLPDQYLWDLQFPPLSLEATFQKELKLQCILTKICVSAHHQVCVQSTEIADICRLQPLPCDISHFMPSQCMLSILHMEPFQEHCSQGKCWSYSHRAFALRLIKRNSSRKEAKLPLVLLAESWKAQKIPSLMDPGMPIAADSKITFPKVWFPTVSQGLVSSPSPYLSSYSST